MSVGWPVGLRLLLDRGADIDVEDILGFTPVDHGIGKGSAEGVGILVSEGCNINVRHTKCRSFRDCLTEAIECHNARCFETWDLGAIVVSNGTCKAVLQELISSLAKRHHRLNHTTAYDNAFRISSDLSAIPFSVLGADLGTVYHIPNLSVSIAEMLWQAGFRDIDVPDMYGYTPITVFRPGRSAHRSFQDELQETSWFITKGANLGHPNISSVDTSIQWPSRRATYFLGHKIGHEAVGILDARMIHSKDRNTDDLSRLTEWRHPLFGQLDEGCMQALADVLLDTHCDRCTCACTSQGCLSSTTFLKSSWSGSRRFDKESLTVNQCWCLIVIGSIAQRLDQDWLIVGTIRFHTFKKLGLKHTCCKIEPRWEYYHFDCRNIVTELDPEEIAEIQEEDREGIELLESLLPEFEEKRRGQDLLQYFKGYWATRMEEVCRTRHEVDQQKLRELGITLFDDEAADIESMSENTDGSDRTGSECDEPG